MSLSTNERALTKSVTKKWLLLFLKGGSEPAPRAPIKTLFGDRHLIDRQLPGGLKMSKMKRAAEVATATAFENRARQAALGFALAFASFVLLTQFVHAFFGQ
jgi:hypothetical protein